VIESVRERVERGTALAEALGQHPAFFSPVYAGVVRAGERSGDLTGAFERLTRRLESEQELRSKLISLSIYPVLLALAGGAAVVVLIAFVLPRFVDLLTASGGALPGSTAALLAISGFFQSYGWIVALAFVATIALIAGASARPAGQRVIARIALALPFIGALRRERLSGTFAGMVGVMTAGGAPLLRALDDTADCVADPVARDEVARIRSRVREGASLRQAIAEGGFFPPLLERLVAVGEESARLPDFLLEAATLFERRTQRTLERMVMLVEPLMILVFGGIVAFIALALLQGIYGINAGSFR
jgi:general secretion pathway protein F